eukprot:744603_1
MSGYTKLAMTECTPLETQFEATQTLIKNDEEDTQSSNASVDEDEQKYNKDALAIEDTRRNETYMGKHEAGDGKTSTIELQVQFKPKEEEKELKEHVQPFNNNLDLERLRDALWYVYHGMKDPFCRESKPDDTWFDWIEAQIALIKEQFDGQNDLFIAHLISADHLMLLMTERKVDNTPDLRTHLVSLFGMSETFYAPSSMFKGYGTVCSWFCSILAYYEIDWAELITCHKLISDQMKVDWDVVAKALSTEEATQQSDSQREEKLKSQFNSQWKEWISAWIQSHPLDWVDLFVWYEGHRFTLLLAMMECIPADLLIKSIQYAFSAFRYSRLVKGRMYPLIKTEGYVDGIHDLTTPMVQSVDHAHQNIIALNKGKYYYEVILTSQDDNELDIDIGWAQMAKIEDEFKVINYWAWNGWRGVITYGSGLDDVHVDENASVPPFKWQFGDRVLCFLDLANDCMVFSSLRRCDGELTRFHLRQRRKRDLARRSPTPFYFEVLKFNDLKPESELIVPIIYARNHQSYYIRNKSILRTSGLYTGGFVDLINYYLLLAPRSRVRTVLSSTNARCVSLHIDFAAHVVKNEIKEWNRTGENASEKIKNVLKLSMPANGTSFFIAVKWATNLHKYSQYFPIIQNEIVQIAKFCEEMAIEIMNTIKSNRLQLLLLEHEDTLGIIIKNELKTLTSSPSLQILRHCIWTTPPTNMIREPNIEVIRNGSVSELRTWRDALFKDYILCYKSAAIAREYHFTNRVQHDYFYSPLGDIQIEFVVYLLYLFFIIYVGISVPDVHKYPMEGKEVLFWICNGSTVMSELVQYLKNSEEYRADRTNKIDIAICIMCLCIFVLRMLSVNDESHCIDVAVDICLYDAHNVFYANFWFILLLLSCLRVVYLSSIFESMALLVSNISRMMADMVSVFMFIVIFVLGFATAIFISTGGELDSYADPVIAMRTTIYGFVDGMDWAEFNDLEG